ncbi:MAG: helix-turn-helix domain-containing protein [Betaproteobacteria bacterium]|nr:helix-turn-helix domain-containing protein [Betaproteobacteria bacterium]
MLLDPDDCYNAWRSRDARFDGRIFVGVRSTGVYCRPVCPSRLPRREQCTFYPSAAAAEVAGYRPCLRCRPELAPGESAVDAPTRLARTAAALIEDGSGEPVPVAALADRLAVSARHLSRVFRDAFGVTPVQYAHTHRLLLAKRLLTETTLPVTDIAFTAGFGSLRRFQAVFTERYGLAPSALRRSVAAAPAETLTFRLGFRPPLAWEPLLAFLSGRTIEGVEHVGEQAYARTVRIEREGIDCTGWIRVSLVADRHCLDVTLSASLAPVVPAVLQRVRRLFDLAADPAAIAARLDALAAPAPGLRLPGAFDGFEMAVRAILGQQITVKAARTLAGRFAAALGTRVETPFRSLVTRFPSSREVATRSVDDIARLGIVGARARAILALAEAHARGDITLEPTADVEAQLARLRALPGIGDWTAQYLAMRALGWPDAFPHTDYGVRKALGTTADREVLARAEAWRPWRAYAVMHLWQSIGGNAK